MTAEQWADVAPGYAVSNLGRVRGKSGRILNPSPNGQGYLCFSIGRLSVKLHVLVARHFVPGRVEGDEVRHLNGDKANCAASNLAWGTHSRNVLDQVEHGTHYTATREECRNGHPYDATNTRRSADGRRHCRACQRAYSQAHRARRVLTRLAHFAEQETPA